MFEPSVKYTISVNRMMAYTKRAMENYAGKLYVSKLRPSDEPWTPDHMWPWLVTTSPNARFGMAFKTHRAAIMWADLWTRRQHQR